MKEISSKLTRLLQALPFVLFGLFRTVFSWNTPWIIGVAYCVGLIVLWYLLRRIPIVQSGPDGLRVIRGGVVASLGFENIKSVSNRFVFGYDCVFVTLHNPLSFGDRFWFLARTRAALITDHLPWASPPEHPVARELRQSAHNCTSQTAQEAAPS